MDRYFLNKNTETNPNNDHEVHKEGCHLLPLRDGIDLGLHPNCQSAVTAAKGIYANSDGCIQCIPECHTR